MTAPQQPAPVQSPAQAPVVQPAPDPAAAPVPAPAVPLGPEDDPERAAIWPPPPEKWLEMMMDARYAIIDEPAEGAKQVPQGADRQAPAPAPSTGQTPPQPGAQV